MHTYHVVCTVSYAATTPLAPGAWNCSRLDECFGRPQGLALVGDTFWVGRDDEELCANGKVKLPF